MFNKSDCKPGEIALRVIRAAKSWGGQPSPSIPPRTRALCMCALRDRYYQVPALCQSYINIASIISACEVRGGAGGASGAMGFCRRSMAFVQFLEDHGMYDDAEHIRLLWAIKSTAKETMLRLGCLACPGSDGGVDTLEAAGRICADMGYPVIIKATAGGGGRGMKVAVNKNALEEAWRTARAEAKSAFGSDAVYIDKYLTTPRHIEVRGDADLCGIKGVVPAGADDWGCEYLDMIIAARLVDGIDGAIAHLRAYSSAHTDCIMTEDAGVAGQFFAQVDSAIVMQNASTQFADGGEFGMGAEIGIATGKLHARGPVGAAQLTSFKYIVQGDGTVR